MPKCSKIMVKLVFNGTDVSETHESELTLYANFRGEIFVKITEPNGEYSFICLDRPTAIRMHKELKKQISYLEGEVNHGE